MGDVAVWFDRRVLTTDLFANGRRRCGEYCNEERRHCLGFQRVDELIELPGGHTPEMLLNPCQAIRISQSEIRNLRFPSCFALRDQPGKAGTWAQHPPSSAE